ncbi:hypothetical protein Pint_00547 [Pistacia integerrima]|uniref:Uncharacterized protein n=1 Tax=Pistacia integerrima TaxID=434235 RepID=A0ACC0ZLG4_9ROSI|nr:hypothetical protein Pint_00547 [Pistacia integerrima]
MERVKPKTEGWKEKLLSSVEFVVWQNLLKEKAIWKVNNGNSVRIMDDSWMPPRMQDIKPIVQTYQKVKGLFSLTGRSWDHHKLVEVYGAKNATKVATIPVNWNFDPEQIVWPRKSNGIYDVKTGYHQRRLFPAKITIHQHSRWLTNECGMRSGAYRHCQK